MIHRLMMLPQRAKYIFETEGLIPLIRQGFKFLVGCLFQYETYYLCENTLKERDVADFMPKIQNFTFKIVSTNQEADELAANGFFDLRSCFMDARQRLDRGAIAFCIFVGRELAHISWLAMTEEAKRSLIKLPYRVDFSNDEVCVGYVMTNPKFRRMGLWTYGYFKRLQFLKERGKVTAKVALHTKSIVSQKGIAKLFGVRSYAKGRYLKILWWKFWKETPVGQSIHPD